MDPEPMDSDASTTPNEVNHPQNPNKNHAEKYVRNLMAEFKACDKNIKKVVEIQTCASIIPGSEPLKPATSQPQVAQQRQSRERIAEPEAMDQNESSMTLKNLSKSLNELEFEDIQGLKRYRNIQLYEPHHGHRNYQV